MESEGAPAMSSGTDLMDADVEDMMNREAKKRKMSNTDNKKSNLEQRLGGILCCVVCLDLPRAAVYQCPNGHLMCAGCFTRILADARLRDETATCPSCRIEISKITATRNLAVENAVSELPLECQFCNQQYPRNSLETHEISGCEERISVCKYNKIGCRWRGPEHERPAHQMQCVHPTKSGAEVMEALKVFDQQLSEERKQYDCIFDLLGYEKIALNEIQLKPYRTEEFVHRLFYESARFTAFNNQWVVKARISDTHRDPTQVSERGLNYQLIIRSKPSSAMNLRFTVVKGPINDITVKPVIYEYLFTDAQNESPYVSLPLPDTAECNRLLAAKTINFRLIMFLLTK